MGERIMKIHYIGKTYKIQEIILSGQTMYVVARNDNKAVYTAYTELEEAKKLWRSMEKENE
jgi:hypothetical protein